MTPQAHFITQGTRDIIAWVGARASRSVISPASCVSSGHTVHDGRARPDEPHEPADKHHHHRGRIGRGSSRRGYAEMVWQLGYTFVFFQHRHRVVDLSLYGFGPAASGLPLTVKT